MIQRIQTLYLFIVVVLSITLIWLPVMSFTSSEEAQVQQYAQLSAAHGLQLTSLSASPDDEPCDANMLQGTWGLLVTTLLITLLAGGEIFLYKRRILQARISIFLAMLCIGYYGVLGIFAYFVRMNYALDWHIQFVACIPLVCMVLTVMATRAILKDEALVRAADRIR